MPAPASPRFDHVAVSVADLDRALACYTGHLGLGAGDVTAAAGHIQAAGGTLVAAAGDHGTDSALLIDADGIPLEVGPTPARA